MAKTRLWRVSCYNKIMNEIIISLIGFAGVLVGAIFGYAGKSRKNAVIEAKEKQETKDLVNNLYEEMSEIKKKLDLHNHYAEKLGDIEKTIACICKDIEFLKKGK